MAGMPHATLTATIKHVMTNTTPHKSNIQHSQYHSQLIADSGFWALHAEGLILLTCVSVCQHDRSCRHAEYIIKVCVCLRPLIHGIHAAGMATQPKKPLCIACANNNLIRSAHSCATLTDEHACMQTHTQPILLIKCTPNTAIARTPHATHWTLKQTSSPMPVYYKIDAHTKAAHNTVTLHTQQVLLTECQVMTALPLGRWLGKRCTAARQCKGMNMHMNANMQHLNTLKVKHCWFPSQETCLC